MLLDLEACPMVIVRSIPEFLNPHSSSLATAGFLKLSLDHAVTSLLKLGHILLLDTRPNCHAEFPVTSLLL